MSKSVSEKQESVVVVHDVSPPSPASVDVASEQAPWESGVRKRFPWLGLGALTVVLLCTMSTLLVLHDSMGESASRWCNGVIEPNVFLSIFNNLANIAITVAVADGIAIAWWRRALAGRTVEELHYSWSFSMSFTSIFMKFRYFNVIALAALAAKIAVIDAVLFQRSLGTTIEIDKFPVYTNFSTFASQVFPITASMGPTAKSIDTFQTEFTYHLDEWLRNPSSSIALNAIPECDAYYCRFTVPAAGFSVDCTESEQEIDYTSLASKALALNQSSGYQNLPVFSTNWSFTGSNTNTSSASILLNSTFAWIWNEKNNDRNGTCQMNLTTIECELRPAVLKYTVTITNQNSAVKLKEKTAKSQATAGISQTTDSDGNWIDHRYDAWSSLGLSCSANNVDPYGEWCGYYNQSWRQLAGVQVVRSIDTTESVAPYAQSTLYGFYLAFANYFTSSATLDWDGKKWSHFENGHLAYSSRDDPSGEAEAGCYLGYYDPRASILEKINLLTLSVATDPYSYYNPNTGFAENSSNPVARDLYWTNRQNYTELFTEKKYTTNEVLKALVNTSNPLPGFDLKQATLQPIEMKKSYKGVHYVTDWKYAYGAVAATALVILCITPVYWKFWDLGRKVTLGPFEIANAFQSPALSGACGAAGEMELVLKQIGKNKVRYVEVTDETGRKYAFQPVQV